MFVIHYPDQLINDIPNTPKDIAELLNKEDVDLEKLAELSNNQDDLTSEGIDEQLVSFDEMKDICSSNNWIINY